MLDEIGSNFWLEDLKDRNPSKMNYQGCVLLDSGRSAIRLALKNEYFSRRVALLPRYICQSVIDAFESFEVFFYDIGKDLSVCKSLFREIVNQIKPSVILTMPYFGFTTDKNIEKELSDCKDNGIILINDITQALFLGNNGIADYTVASLRKWFPIPDGGFLRSEKNIKLRSVNPQPSLSSTIRLEAMSEKRKDVYGTQTIDKNKYFDLFDKAENTLDTQNEVHYISDTSKDILARLNYAEIALKRKENFNYLYDGLKDVISPIFPKSEKEVALFFPMYVQDNLLLKKYLTINNIFLPILWPKHKQWEDNSQDVKFIFNHIICVPCDQRYSKDNMEKIIYYIKKFYEKA